MKQVMIKTDMTFDVIWDETIADIPIIITAMVARGIWYPLHKGRHSLMIVRMIINFIREKEDRKDSRRI